MKQKLYYVVFFIGLILLHIGWDYEFHTFLDETFSVKELQAIASGVLLLFLYIIPLMAALLYLQRAWRKPPYVLFWAIFCGVFLAGWSSANLNDWLAGLLQQILPDQATFEAWEGALTAPFIEETLKAGAALFALYTLKNSQLSTSFLVGAGAGLGFQVAEDISFIQHFVLKEPDHLMAGTFSRIYGSLTSHWMMTALVTTGIIMLVFHRKHRKLGCLLIGASVLFHFFWNSPFSSIELPFSIHVVLLASLYALLFVYTFKLIHSQRAI